MKEEINTWTGAFVITCFAVVFSLLMVTVIANKTFKPLETSIERATLL